MNGQIYTLNRERGYGHVRADTDPNLELFWHCAALVDEVISDFSLGDHVEFEPAMTPKGPAAYAVRHATLAGTVVYMRIGGPAQHGAGYGFLRPDDGGEDRFFHHTRLAPVGLPPGAHFAALTVGTPVSYREARGRVGQRDRAVDVRLLAPRPAEGPWRPQFINHTPLQEPTMTTNNTTTDIPSPEHAEGTVDRIIADRGFGFIRPHNAHGRDGLFFHMRSLLPRGTFDSLEGGEHVTYVRGTDGQGRPCATDVRLLDADGANTAAA